MEGVLVKFLEVGDFGLCFEELFDMVSQALFVVYELEFDFSELGLMLHSWDQTSPLPKVPPDRVSRFFVCQLLDVATQTNHFLTSHPPSMEMAQMLGVPWTSLVVVNSTIPD